MKDHWFKYKVIDRYTRNKFFGGRKYYMVFDLGDGNIKEWRVSESNYYNLLNEGEIHLYSQDGVIWFPYKDYV